MMDDRARFHAVMDYAPVDRVPLHLAGPWEDTVRRWEREGLPAGVDPHVQLGVESRRLKVHNFGYAFGLWPRFEPRVLERTTEYTVTIDAAGRTVRNFNDHTSMPEFLKQPVSSPAELRRILDEHLDPARMAERFPAELRGRLEAATARGELLMVNGGGFYWTLRELAGVDGAGYLIYDAPELVGELFDRLEEQILEGWRRIAEWKLVPDVVGYGEDIAFKTGPLVSPEWVRREILPRYRRILAAAHRLGVRHTWYDSDGDLSLLLPDFLEIGIDGVSPCEVAAGMQPNRLRHEFGRALRLIGGVDKRELARGRAAIDRELERLRPVIEEGGYLPAVDHSVSSDISWSDYQYFVEQLQRYLER